MKNKKADPAKGRWWNDKGLEDSQPPAFQRYSFDDFFGNPHRSEPISSTAFHGAYGDKSLATVVNKLLSGLHEAVVLNLNQS